MRNAMRLCPGVAGLFMPHIERHRTPLAVHWMSTDVAAAMVLPGMLTGGLPSPPPSAACRPFIARFGQRFLKAARTKDFGRRQALDSLSFIAALPEKGNAAAAAAHADRASGARRRGLSSTSAYRSMPKLMVPRKLMLPKNTGPMRR